MIDLIYKLRDKTGWGIMECKKAIEYANGDIVKAEAYLKAKRIAVNTRGMTFDERVKRFEENIK